MKHILRLEEAAMTALAICFLTSHNLNISIWIWILLFFTPDVSMLGYLANARIGAFTYNVFHHKGLAIVCIALGYFMGSEIVLTSGILLFAHASFDRILGYGLKYKSGFNDTHLGPIKSETGRPEIFAPGSK
jgi:uncharacterized protein DUF4260